MVTTGMTSDEIRASRVKLGVKGTEVKHIQKKECEEYSCNETATEKCKYCGKSFCAYHLDPELVITAQYVNTIDKSDYERWKKYQDDWHRKDGHPCPAYTTQWNNEHRAKIAMLATSKWGSSSNRNRWTPYVNSSPNYRSIAYTNKKSIKIAIVVILLVVIGLGIAYVFSQGSFSGLLGSPASTPTQSTISFRTNITNSPSNNNSGFVPLQTLIQNASSYLNKTVTTNGLLIQINLSDQVPDSYSLFDKQGESMQVILPISTAFQNRTNYTIMGLVSIYDVKPAQWNGYTSNYQVFYINGSIKTIPTSTQPTSSTISESSENLTFCINRGIFRTSNSRGLNDSQIQQLINYCEYYNYNPGIVNGTNETVICQGVYECQNGGMAIR